MNNHAELPGSRVQRLQLLYAREVDGLPWRDWRTDVCLNTDESQGYLDWRSRKRKFAVDEVSEGIWTKTCTGGYVTELRFHADGTLDEFTLFERVHVPGTWRLSDEGTLEVNLRAGGSVYQIEALASSLSAIHTAVEFQDGQPHALLKLMQLVDLRT